MDAGDKQLNVRISLIQHYTVGLSSSCGLSAGIHCCSYENAPCTLVLSPMIGRQANVQQCKAGLHHPQLAVTWSARWPVPVSWEWGHAGSEGSIADESNQV